MLLLLLLFQLLIPKLCNESGGALARKERQLLSIVLALLTMSMQEATKEGATIVCFGWEGAIDPSFLLYKYRNIESFRKVRSIPAQRGRGDCGHALTEFTADVAVKN